MSKNIHKNIHLTFKKAVKLRAKEHVRSVFFFYAQENLVNYCIIVFTIVDGVEALGRGTVEVEPPVTQQLLLVEECTVRANKTVPESRKAVSSM